MSYLVLARKWRPQNFEDLVGQDHVGRTLANAIKSGRIHHAFLFTGARGVGKTSAARILAKALNCEQGLSAQPCNTCSSCREIAAGQGVDVFEIDGASNTGVDDIRDLRENIRYLPSRSRYKIFIIDEVHMLSINAFNALLKTLEEPPAHAKFIFATTEPHKIPDTILSRCQRFDFRKISLSKIAAKLREIVDAEGIPVSARSLAAIARRGEGSMRDALSSLDQIIAFCGEEISDDDVQGVLGLVDRKLLLETARGILQRDSRLLLEAVRRVDDLGHSFRRFAQALVEFFRELVLLKVTPEPEEFLEATGNELAELQAVAELGSLEDFQRTLTLLLKTETDLAGAPFPRLILEMALVRLAHLPPAQDIAMLLRKIEELEGRLGGNRPTPPAPPAERPEPPAARTLPPKKVEAPAPGGNSIKGWPGLVEEAKKHRPRIGSLLEHGSLLSLDLPELKIGFPAGSFLFEQMKDRETQERLQKLAEAYFGQSVRIGVVPIDGRQKGAPPSLREEREAKNSDRRQRLRKDALGHPMVQAIQDIFKGEITEVKPIDKGFV